MAKWIENLIDVFSRGIPTKPIPSGIFHYQSSPESEIPYRLHLRLEGDGTGILIINAHTSLHLNQTAAEYAYYIVQGFTEEQVIAEITQRYSIKKEQASSDYQDLLENIHLLATSEDVDPVSFLNFDREEPYPSNLSAPYRLDCALTYRSSGQEDLKAPVDRVKRELLTEEWQSILSKAWHAGIPHIIFTGGEPTTRPDLTELISYAQSLGQVTGLLTNGHRLSDHNYFQSLLNCGLDHVMILLDPLDSQSWEAVRDTLVEDIFLTVHLTLDNKNAEEAIKTINRLNKMGVKHLSITIQYPELRTRMDEVANYAASQGLNLIWDIPVPYTSFNTFRMDVEDENIAAGAGTGWLYVEPDGDVLPGQGINRVLGNLLTNNWDEIWSNRKAAS